MADKHVFAKLLFQSGNMTELEHELYLKIFDSLNELFRTPRLHRFIYLRTSPERCLERMKKRGRFEEKGISLDYLKKIHDLHEKWLKNENAIVIDGEE